MKRMVVFAMCVCGWVAAGATRAEAQMSMGAFRGYLTGQAGWATGGDVSSPVFTPGVSVSVQEESGWGAEFDFGYAADLNAGGGAVVAVNDLVAVRGDARYFRTLADHPDLRRPENFGFWRVSLGVSLTWVISP